MATSHKVILAETLSPTFVGLTFQVVFHRDIGHNDDDDDCYDYDDDDEDSLPDLCWSHYSGGFSS